MLDLIMRIIGFSGFGDSTDKVKVFYISVLFSFFIMCSASGIVNELMIGSLAYDLYNDITWSKYFIFGVAFVISCFVVAWRHIPLIILFSLLSVVGAYTGAIDVYNIGTQGDKKVWPANVREWAAPSEEFLKELENLKEVRFARIRPDRTNTDEGTPEREQAGRLLKLSKGKDKGGYPFYTLRYMNEEWTIQERVDDLRSGFNMIRTNRSVKIIASGSLMSSESENADVIKEIRKGDRVILTGESSKRDLPRESGLVAASAMLEVIHNGDKGWLATESVFKRIEAAMPLKDLFGVGDVKFSKTAVIVILLILVIMYILNWLRAFKSYKTFFTNQRKKYRWFENYVQEAGDPTVSYAFEDTNEKLLAIILSYLAIAFGIGYIFSFAGRWVAVYLYIPISKLDYVLNCGLVVGPLLAVVVAQLIWNYTFVGVKSVCKHCACTLSRIVIKSLNVVTNIVDTTTKTTTEYSDGSTNTETSRNRHYEGKTHDDYKCFNCKREDQEKYSNTWSIFPYTKPQYFEPPKAILAATEKTDRENTGGSAAME